MNAVDDALAAGAAPAAAPLVVSPRGTLLVQGSTVSPAIARAFERGEGHGLLHLATAELARALPEGLAFFRELGRAFLTRLCTLADLEERRERVEVPPDSDALDALARAVPPIPGAEYVTREGLERLWRELGAAVAHELAAHQGNVQSWLDGRNAAWNAVGRVTFHLAENRGDDAAPFAFLATYTARLSSAGKAQHRPLGQARAEYAGAKNHAALLSLLVPVQRAAERSPLVRALVDSNDIYTPLRWTPAEAHAFLKEVPRLEEAGVIVRIPDWWKARRPPRAEVVATVGETRGKGLGADALLSFRVEIALDGEPLTEEEWAKLKTSADGLVFLRGKWIEVDREKLGQVLSHWRAVEEGAGEGGVSFLEGMRLLSGVTLEAEKDPAAEERPDWSRVVAGDSLRRALDELAAPGAARDADPGAALKTELRPYQKAGVAWLWRLNALGLGGCLADDMGLGKTIQVLALLLLLKKAKRGPSLLVVPASLVANWKAEAERFAPDLRVLCAHASERPNAELSALRPADVAAFDAVITTYGSAQKYPWVAKTRFELAVLDEAQAIKNPGARQTRAVKALDARVRLALTGTPVENRLADLWSLFDFLCPGLLGSAKQFTAFARRLAESEAPQRYAPLRSLVSPYVLRRLKTDRTVIQDLPDKTEVKAYCTLTKKQAVLYEETVRRLAKELATRDSMARRGLVLATLLRLKQVCNHPAHGLEEAWDPVASGKLARLRELTEPIAARQEKALVFTQFREATEPLARFLEGVFGRPGLVLSGDTRVKERRALVDGFQDERGPPFFVLSLKAGGTGLNLTAASHVIHFDRWWNPAVESQATDRAYRIGQKNNVLVHRFICRGTVEEKVDALIESKRELATSVVEGGGEVLLTELGNDELLRLVSLDLGSALGEG